MSFLNLKAILSLNGAGFALGMKRAESQAKQFAKEIKSQFAAAFGTAAVIAYGKHIITMADNLIDLSDQLGISTDALQEFQYAARKSGSTAEAVAKLFENLAAARTDALNGDPNAIKKLNAVGIDDFTSMEVMMKQLQRKVQTTAAEDIIGPLRDVGGKAATSLIPMFQTGIEAMAAIAREQRQITARETLNEAKALAEQLEDLKDTARPIATEGLAWLNSKLPLMIAGSKALATVGKAFGLDVMDAKKGKMPSRGKGAFADAFGTLLADAFNFSKPKPTTPAGGTSTAALDYYGAAGERRAIDFGRMGTSPDTSAIARQAAETSLRSMMTDRPSLNSWQQLGAAVRFNPNDSGREIAKNTAQSVKEQREIRLAIKELQGGGFGGDF